MIALRCIKFTVEPSINGIIWGKLWTTINFDKSNFLTINISSYRVIGAMVRNEPKLIIDCGFENDMMSREVDDTAKQIEFSFAANRQHREPFVMHLCNLNRYVSGFFLPDQAWWWALRFMNLFWLLICRDSCGMLYTQECQRWAHQACRCICMKRTIVTYSQRNKSCCCRRTRPIYSRSMTRANITCLAGMLSVVATYRCWWPKQSSWSLQRPEYHLNCIDQCSATTIQCQWIDWYEFCWMLNVALAGIKRSITSLVDFWNKWR